MSLNNKLLSQAKNAGEVNDQSVTTTGFGPRIPEKGVAFARFIGYVELGKQPREYEGKAKDPALTANLTFEVYGKKNKDEYEDKDGNKETSYRVLRVGNLLVSSSAKAKFKSLLSDMAYGRDIKHMAEMLGEVFKVEIVHNKVGKRTYANLKTISGPFKEETDDDGEVELIDMSSKIKPTKRDMQLFIFDAPTLEMWSSIHIEGEREVTEENEDGEKVVSKVSNNFLQETIMEATDFRGSPMEALLAGMDDEEDEIEEDDEDEEELEVEDIDLDEDDEDEDEVEEEPKPKKKKVVAKKSAGTAAKKASTTTKQKGGSVAAKTASPSKKKKEEVDEDELIDELFDEDE